jgi:hypothetical protein
MSDAANLSAASARSHRRRSAVFFLAFIALSGWIYMFLFSEYFTISRVEIFNEKNGFPMEEGRVAAEALRVLDEERVWPFRARNIFFIDRDALGSRIEEELFIEKVVVDKKYPSILRLKLKERESSVIIRIGEEYAEVDHTGIVTRILGTDEAAGLERVADSPRGKGSSIPMLSLKTFGSSTSTIITSTTIVAHQSLTEESRVVRWLNALQRLKERGFGYRRVSLDTVSSTKLSVRLFEPYEVYFDLLTPLDAQIDGYYAFIKNKPQGTDIQEYIDARIPGKIFYQ